MAGFHAPPTKDEWIDHDDENQFLMLNLNLTMPVIDNRCRRKKVIAGMRTRIQSPSINLVESISKLISN